MRLRQRLRRFRLSAEVARANEAVETRFVGAEDLAPGERAQPLAISRKPAEPVLTPKLVKAQRY
ncbi:hypothetical protein [Streptomyces sp. NBC_00878]|uniref:hypothetical protein n=1 Tax=Streptomyces sp. NBC_00878 TaxID=2975854 RepID=UPI0022548A72|nr:hypothetical protein [Streptomyces sp. NBC_00878]MCX4911726.1 hypothetical protein [Streptomyces sp. NBC_00878]